VRILDKVITGKPGLKLKIDLSKLGMTAARMNALREFKVIQHSELLRRDIPHMTWIGSFVTDGNLTRITGEHNTSAASIDKELPRFLYGPLLYYALDRNLDATDFRNLVDHLRWEDYHRMHIVGPTQEYTLGTVQSVMANCFGDTQICHQPGLAKYPLLVDALSPNNNQAMIELPIGDLIGIPLVAVKSAVPGLPWRGRVVRDTDDQSHLVQHPPPHVRRPTWKSQHRAQGQEAAPGSARQGDHLVLPEDHRGDPAGDRQRDCGKQGLV
jgi:hypothetical protein